MRAPIFAICLCFVSCSAPQTPTVAGQAQDNGPAVAEQAQDNGPAVAGQAQDNGPAVAEQAQDNGLLVRTYNVNYGLAGDEQTLETVGRGAPDIVLLQETNAAWEQTIENRWSKTFPYRRFHHCCGAGGLAVLSKLPIIDVRIVEPPHKGWFPAMIVQVQSAKGMVQFINVHLHPPVNDNGSFVSGYFSTKNTRREEVQTYYAERDPDLPTIIAGDFNESKSGRAVQFLDQYGFESVPTDGNKYDNTWRWRTSVGSVSAQLDHVVVDQNAFDTLDANVIDAGRSDHLPVDVWVRLKSEK